MNDLKIYSKSSNIKSVRSLIFDDSGNLYAASQTKIIKIVTNGSSSILTTLGNKNLPIMCLEYNNNILYASVWDTNSKNIIWKIELSSPVKLSILSTIVSKNDPSVQAIGLKYYKSYLYATVIGSGNYYLSIYKINIQTGNTFSFINGADNILQILNDNKIENPINCGYLEIDTLGNFYLADNNKIIKYNSVGNLININFIKISNMNNILINNNNIFCSKTDGTINIYDMNGKFITKNEINIDIPIPTPDNSVITQGMVFDKNNNFYFSGNYDNTVIYVINSYTIPNISPTITPGITLNPTTQMPTTQIPTTQMPTTQMPTTQMPTTQMPTTQMPTTQMPTTQMPTTQMPTTQMPTTQMPIISSSTTLDNIKSSECFDKKYGDCLKEKNNNMEACVSGICSNLLCNDNTTPFYDCTFNGTQNMKLTRSEAIANCLNNACSKYNINNYSNITIPTKSVSTTQMPTTQIPTTQIPTTQMPTTRMPTTQMPTTQMPTTQMPTTQMPTTQMPTTQMPTTQMPTTQMPTNKIPTIQMPTTQIPTTQMPTTQMPTTQIPTTQMPTTQMPTTQMPTTQMSTTQMSTTQMPTTQMSTTQMPTNQIPTILEPTTQQPTIEITSSEITIPPYYSNSEVKNESKINIDNSKYKFTTTLTSPIQKNDLYIYVKDQINFKIGDLIEINDSVNISIRKVIGFSSIIVDKPIDYNYKIGTKVSILKTNIENNSNNNNESNITILIICIISILLILSLSIIIYLYSNKN